MPEHLIRLRRGWLRVALQAPGDGSDRVTLPLAGFPDPGRRVLLTRSFQRPPVDPDREALWLRLEAVPGLNSVVLNGRSMTAGGPLADSLLLPVGDDLPARSVLVLDVGPAHPVGPLPWGEVALVIVGRDVEPGGRGEGGLQ